jgi:hypothetical protein
MQPMTEPFPITAVTLGMIVLDPAGAEAGTVTAVQLPGTDVRPDVAAGVAEELMGAGYIRIDGSGFLTNDTYAGGDQIRTTDEGEPGVVHLRVSRDQLFRAG